MVSKIQSKEPDNLELVTALKILTRNLTAALLESKDYNNCILECKTVSCEKYLI